MIKHSCLVYLRRSSTIKIDSKEKLFSASCTHFLESLDRNVHFGTNSSKVQEELTKSKRIRSLKTAHQVEEDDINEELTKSRKKKKAACEIEEDQDDDTDSEVIGGSRKPRVTKVMEYFSSGKHGKSILDIFPPEFSRKKKKVNKLYVAEEDIADQIVSTVVNHIPKECDFVVEINPGPGLITKKLLEHGYRLKLFEANEFFLPQIRALQKNNSNILLVEHIDLLQIYVNNYTRTNIHHPYSGFYNSLKDFEKKPWKADTVKMICGVANSMFLGNLVINCFNCQGFPAFGRPELFCYILPSVYRKFTSSPFKDKVLYRTNSVLFQNVFHCEILSVLPRQSFLPWGSLKHVANSYLAQMYAENENFLYLARICGKRDFYDNFASEVSLSSYLRFVRQFFKYHGLRVIPLLEQWFPNCGPKLIEAKIGVFTSFSDLTPSRCQALFSICRSFPNFEQSPFFSFVSQFNADSFAASDKKKAFESDNEGSRKPETEDGDNDDDDDDVVSRL